MGSELYLNDNYLDEYSSRLKGNLDKIKQARVYPSRLLDIPSTEHYWKALNALPEFKTNTTIFDQKIVQIGDKNELDAEGHKALEEVLRVFRPWRKGPWNYFGTEIDTEWKSYMKLDRMMEKLVPGELEGKRILDIGCNNLYYMYRLLTYNPEIIVGFDPIVRYYFHHLFNKRFVQSEKIQFEMLGIDHAGLFEGFFDYVFFMGILYHRRDPMGALKQVYDSLRVGGTLLMECCGIPGDDSTMLFPEGRYCNSPGYWFLPTWKAIESMLKRSGFENIETFYCFTLSNDEQRKTEWIDTHSLEDFLDPNDPTKTIEGYPAPVRIYTKATKRKR